MLGKMLQRTVTDGYVTKTYENYSAVVFVFLVLCTDMHFKYVCTWSPFRLKFATRNSTHELGKHSMT